jgi:hypothetical protein
VVSDLAGVPPALMAIAALAQTTIPIALLLGPHIAAARDETPAAMRADGS